MFIQISLNILFSIIQASHDKSFLLSNLYCIEKFRCYTFHIFHEHVYPTTILSSNYLTKSTFISHQPPTMYPNPYPNTLLPSPLPCKPPSAPTSLTWRCAHFVFIQFLNIPISMLGSHMVTLNIAY